MATMTQKRHKPNVDASPQEIKDYLKHLQKERESHIKASEVIDKEMLTIYQRLGKTLQQNGRLSNTEKSHRGVRPNAGTGKILAIITRLSRNGVARTADVKEEAIKRHKIKYPDSSFQSLQSSGIIKLATPERGFITLMK